VPRTTRKPKALTRERTRVDRYMATLLRGEDDSPARSTYDQVRGFATHRRDAYPIDAMGFTDR